jgi:hypothetical protein
LLERFVHHNFVTSQLYLYFFLGKYHGTPLEGLLPIVRIINRELLKISKNTVGVWAPDFAIPDSFVLPGGVQAECESGDSKSEH